MTDKIIKALECIAREEIKCAECAYGEYCYPVCQNLAGGDALNLIKSQKAEIERVKKTVFDTCLELSGIYTIAKDKAIKDFAKQVKMELCYEFDGLLPSSIADRIDNLVKEMIGDQE